MSSRSTNSKTRSHSYLRDHSLARLIFLSIGGRCFSELLYLSGMDNKFSATFPPNPSGAEVSQQLLSRTFQDESSCCQRKLMKVQLSLLKISSECHPLIISSVCLFFCCILIIVAINYQQTNLQGFKRSELYDDNLKTQEYSTIQCGSGLETPSGRSWTFREFYSLK